MMKGITKYVFKINKGCYGNLGTFLSILYLPFLLILELTPINIDLDKRNIAFTKKEVSNERY